MGAYPEPAALPTVEQDREQLVKIMACVHLFEEGVGRSFRERCLRFYHQYRGFRRFAEAHEMANPRDRDEVVYDARKHWGAHLHIPLSFRTIETVVPRALSQMPRLLVSPRNEQWQENVKSVRMMIDAQQEQIDIDLAFQAVMRSGQIYGLGVGKAYWLTETRNRRVATLNTKDETFYQGPMSPVTTFDDPMFEDVDVFDFMWDVRACDIRSAGWTCHRLWLSRERVEDRLQSGAWATASAQEYRDEPSKLNATSSESMRYTEVWAERMQASGFPTFATGAPDMPHEVLEYHDGEQVFTVLDRTALVQQAETPAGEMPFQIYRPVPLTKQFVGIGALEPLEDLQRELDTLRSQRRDAATIALARGFSYNPEFVKPEDLVFGPAAAIPVDGDVNEGLKQLQVADVPGSAYQDEAAIMGNFEQVAGMADALDNSPSGESTTATEAQLVQAAQGRRIEMTSRRFEIEVVRNVCRQFLQMDQRMILEPRPPLRQPEDGMSAEDANAQGRWKWFPIGPNELQGEYEIVPEGGSMMARNVPQDRSDATQIMSMFAGDFYVDPTKIRLQALRLMGVQNPEAMLRAQEPSVPMVFIKFLERAGVDVNLIKQAELRARETSAPEEGQNDAGGEAAPAAVGVAQ